jgi:HNH endonuclease
MTLQDRFDAKYIPEPNSGCWLWTAAALQSGYGILCLDLAIPPKNKERLAHRISWILKNGEIPSGMHVLHRCDMPCCVNPDHLFLGTSKDNTHDQMKKQRMPLGEGRRFAKLHEEAVRQIRTSDKSDIALAKQFGVSDSAVWMVRSGRTWKHVGG